MVKHHQVYIPRRGDLIFLDFNPTKGHEQSGHRPAFVISPQTYNAKTSLALLIPITKQRKGYPFEVPLSPNLQIQGVILVDQIKCLDWQVRQVRFVETAPQNIVEEVQAKLKPLIF
ncbi:mRNA-degrading endonuclease [Picosynechococcus sp. PCC 7003]|uniref:endoribonuclease MazF n=1 Tax=Picosynechococcus sp. PCC 7003 TaxID=374981 RepID=UPI00081068B5|nr:endoribonuclease MazF [Picosynechococcus sp. PCC 7003]ANV83646.1 mRNA-degrading endonuclease [Picosynechococcus sp. PCC 7003]